MLFPIKIVYLFPSRTFAWGTWWKGMLACNFRLWVFFFIQSITTDSDKNNSSVQCLTWTWKSGSCRLFTAILPLALRFSWARDAFFSTQIIFCLFCNVCMFNYFLNPRKCLNKSFCTVVCEKVLPCAETGWLVSLILCPCTAGSSVIIPCFHGAAFNQIPLPQVLLAVLASQMWEVSLGLLSSCSHSSCFKPLVII